MTTDTIIINEQQYRVFWKMRDARTIDFSFVQPVTINRVEYRVSGCWRLESGTDIVLYRSDRSEPTKAARQRAWQMLKPALNVFFNTQVQDGAYGRVIAAATAEAAEQAQRQMQALEALRDSLNVIGAQAAALRLSEVELDALRSFVGVPMSYQRAIDAIHSIARRVPQEKSQ
jgi:hypothetical protein